MPYLQWWIGGAAGMPIDLIGLEKTEHALKVSDSLMD